MKGLRFVEGGEPHDFVEGSRSAIALNYSKELGERRGNAANLDSVEKGYPSPIALVYAAF
jgi:hypothetical protein